MVSGRTAATVAKSMAKPSKTAKAKRERERARQDWQKEKLERRALRSESKKDRSRLIAEGVDPDLDGIVPGPQQPPTDGS